MSTVDTSTWNPDPDLNESLEGIPLNSEARIDQTWQALRILMAAGGLHGLQLVPFTGATASADGKQGLVPAPEAGDQDKLLKGDGTWGTLSASDIPNIDASKITSGTIDIARLPAGALERLVTVADQTARYALTAADVQLGDTVKQLDTGIMYLVVDTTKLGQAAGYVEYTAGSAASVPWSGVTGKPSSFTPSSHTHGNITNDGNLGTASRAVVTDGNKKITVSSVTSTELGYISGVTSAVQTQINGKAADSSVVHKTGDETVAGVKTFTGNIVVDKSNPRLFLQNADIAKGTSPAENAKFTTIAFTDSEGYSVENRVGFLESYIDTNGTACTQIAAYKNEADSTDYGAFGIKYDADGTSAYTFAPTPATSDNSTKIATTAFVKAQGYITSSGSITGNAATASAVPWSGVTDKPSSYTPSSHTHGNLTNGGAIGSTSGLPVITGTSGVLEAGAVISTAQIAAMFENDGIDPDDPPMTYPERAVLCGDGAWRYFEQIPFPEDR